MAIGDKRPVVMQSDRAANDGIATLDGTGNVPYAQLGNAVRSNLLHNWYFANCVNQRGQTAYTGAVYTIDRWKMSGASAGLTVNGGYVACSAGTTVQHPLEADVIAAITGVPLTFSILMDTGLVYGTATYDGSAKSFYGNENTAVRLRISNMGHPYITANTAVNIIAAKLELGSTQTLAHQENGAWVLNEIPDFGEELAKCQRFYQLFTTAEKRPADKRDFRPELRTNATSANTGTVEINGVTYYYASAEL